MSKPYLLKTELIFLSLFICFWVSSQNVTEFTKFYLQGAVGLTFHNGLCIEIGAGSILKNKWVLGFSYQHIKADPKNLPDDYDGDFYSFYSVTDFTPTVKFDHFNLTGGRSFATGNYIWIITQAGVSLGTGNRLTFMPTDPQSGNIANYEYTTEKKSIAGGIVKTDFNWAFASFMGLGATVFANINSVQNAFGANVKLIFGKLLPRTNADQNWWSTKFFHKRA